MPGTAIVKIVPALKFVATAILLAGTSVPLQLEVVLLVSDWVTLKLPAEVIPVIAVLAETTNQRP